MRGAFVEACERAGVEPIEEPLFFCRPRYVAAPWERITRPVRVGLEDHVEPDPVALAMYLSVFPDRRVRWNRDRQLFEIRQQDDAGESRIEFVFYYDAPPNPITGEAFSEEQLAQLIEKRSPILHKVFRHFDQEFVNQRLRERLEWLELGTKKYNDRVADRNRQRWKNRLRGVISEAAARIGDNRHYLKYVGPDGKPDPKQRYRPEFTPVEVDLKAGGSN